MNKIFFFSNNVGKQEEIKTLFKNFRINIFFPEDFKITYEPKEVGNSFANNAKIKSLFGYEKTHIPCFADDSGISIEALGWKPNIMSKRFIDSFKNSTECFNYIIKKTKESGKIKAYFKTSICYTFEKNYHVLFEGKIEGIISEKIKGKNGFGYDPIFLPNGSLKTFGEMTERGKNFHSHRGIAINKLINFLFN